MPSDKVSLTPANVQVPQTLEFQTVRPLLSTPLEISEDRLRCLNMVDETIIVRAALRQGGKSP